MIANVPTSVAYRSTQRLSGELWIVENSALESMLFSRNILGHEFSSLCFQASTQFLRHVFDELSERPSVAELVILSKGLTYRLGEAFAHVMGTSLPTNLIATRRASVESDGVSVDTMYERLDAGGSTILIGDTVASGATIVAALAKYRQSHDLDSVYLFSFAGAGVGAAKIDAYCSSVGIELRMFFGLAAFGLADNGFDLSFLDPGTETRDDYRARAHAQFDGSPASAVGWDFGSQVMSPTKYRQLCWMEAEKWGLHGHPAFALELRPTDMSLLAGESSAFG